MPTFVRYNLRTGEIFSEFTTSSDEFVPLPNSDDEGVLEISQDQLPNDLTPSVPGTEILRGRVSNGQLHRLRREPAFPVQIQISTDLPDRSGDGSVVAPADGETMISVRATIEGSGVRNDDAITTVRFRTTRGALSRRIAEVKDGVAEVELRAIAETTDAVVSASTEGSRPASLRIEFIPVEEYASGPPHHEPA